MKTTFKHAIVTFLVAIVASIGFSHTEASANLTENTLPAQIQEAISNYDTSAEFQYVGNVKNLNKVVKSTIEELKTNDPYTHLNLKKWQLSYKGTTKAVTLSFKFTYLTDAKKEAYVDDQIPTLTQAITKHAKTDFEKVKAIHDYIVLNAQYSRKTSTSQYTAYTLLTEKKGVCQAYTALAYRLLTEAGIETKVAVGKAKKEAHSWNMVKLGGQWYHLDVTFADPLNNKSNLVNYDFFLVTDKQLKKTHNWAAKTVPVAKNEKYSVFNQVKQAVQTGNVVHFYDSKTKKYRTLNVKTLKITNSTASKYKSAVKKAK